MDDLAAQRMPADYFRRQAAQARRLAGDATTPAVKERGYPSALRATSGSAQPANYRFSGLGTQIGANRE